MTAPGPDQEYEAIVDDDSFIKHDYHGFLDDTPMVTVGNQFVSDDGQVFSRIEDYYDYVEFLESEENHCFTDYNDLKIDPEVENA